MEITTTQPASRISQLFIYSQTILQRPVSMRQNNALLTLSWKEKNRSQIRYAKGFLKLKTVYINLFRRLKLPRLFLLASIILGFLILILVLEDILSDLRALSATLNHSSLFKVAITISHQRRCRSTAALWTLDSNWKEISQVQSQYIRQHLKKWSQLAAFLHLKTKPSQLTLSKDKYLIKANSKLLRHLSLTATWKPSKKRTWTFKKPRP